MRDQTLLSLSQNLLLKNQSVLIWLFRFVQKQVQHLFFSIEYDDPVRYVSSSNSSSYSQTCPAQVRKRSLPLRL